MGNIAKSKVVATHSTYVAHLMASLHSLAQYEDVTRIVPARIYRTRRGGNNAQLHFRITTPVENGFKVLARNGNSAQEVFVYTAADQATLQELLDR